MPQIDMPYTVHLDQSMRVTPLSTLFAKGDNAAHKFALTVLRGGVQDDLNGCTVNCKFYRMAESTVVNMTGTVEDSKAVAVLDKACYDYTGRFTMTISIKQGEASTTVFYGDGYMQGRSADTAITGEYIVYDIDTLLAKLDEIDAATSAANTAAGSASAAAGAANTAAGSANTAAGSAQSAASAATKAAQAANAAAARLDGLTATATGLPASSAPTVSVTTDEDGAKRLDFGIPKGEKGDTGATPKLKVTAKTGEPGTEASVVQSGTAENPVLDLTIPRGATGDIGALKINGKTPDSSGAVTLEMGDIDGLNDAIAGAGKVKTVAGVAPGEDGNVALDAGKIGYGDSDVGAALSQLKDDKLDKTETAADSAKLGGKAPDEYAAAEDVARLKDEKVNKSDALTLEEIEASTDLTGKIASASGLKTLSNRFTMPIKLISNINEAKPSNYSVGFYVIPYNGIGTPTAAWYYIIAFSAENAHYSKLAIGMTDSAVYYQFSDSDTWSRII